MLLHLVRHGIAVDREDPSVSEDSERPLTPKGRRRTRQSARGMRALGVSPKHVFVSPYVRAQQTSEIVCDVLRVPADGIVESTALLPGAEIGDFGHLIWEWSKGEDAMCIGHAPHLDLLLARMLGLREPVSSLKKAGLATLELQAGEEGNTARRAQLLGLYPPKVLRVYAKGC